MQHLPSPIPTPQEVRVILSDTRPERRINSGGLEPFGAYTIGIRRVVEQAIHELRIHDDLFSHFDRGIWQVNYSLQNHHTRVRSVMAALGEAWHWNDRDIFIGEVGAQLHDMGKTDEECRNYRLNRRLTPEEKRIVDTHAGKSGEYVRRLKTRVRAEDHPTLDDIHVVASSHHEPELVEDPRLRRITTNLHLSDIFVSVQEERERPGRSQFQAIDMLHEIVERKLKGKVDESYQHELLASMVMITQLFGVNLRKIEEEVRPDA